MVGTFFSRMNGSTVRQFALTLLRVTTGFLLIWWGLNKIVSTGLSTTISDQFYGGAFSVTWLLVAFGVVQALVGVLVVLGLFRRFAYLFQLAVNGFTAAAVWYAIVDPFRWYLPPQSQFPFTQLFYPSAIVLAASFLLVAFCEEERWTLDRRLGRA